MAWNSILFYHYFCLSFWHCYYPHCEKMCGTRSLTKTKGTVSVLWPHPPACSTCPQELPAQMGFSSLMQVSRAESLEGTSLLLIKTRDHKSLLGSCCQTTLGWSELSDTNSHFWVFVIQKWDVKDAPGGGLSLFLLSHSRNSGNFVPDKQEKHQPLNFTPLCCPICVGFSPSLIVI